MQKQNLILLPGLLSNEHVWLHQIKQLSNYAQITVIPLRQNTTEKMMEEVLSTAPEKFALAGHSVGGRVAMEIALTAPERISKLCLLNTTCQLDSIEKHNFRKQILHRANNGMFTIVVDELTELFLFNKNLRDEVKTMFLSEGLDIFNNQQNAMLTRSDCCPLLHKINCPTLVIHADKDAAFPYEVNKELADLIPNAKFAVVSESGHMSPMENPENVTALLGQWLEISN